MALRMKEVIGMVLRKRLRKLVEAEEILILPGAYDALSAKLVQAAGFQAVYLTFTAFFSDAPSFAPVYLPTRASPAYAKPSMKYE